MGFLTKDAGRDQIALAVRSAAAGQSVLDPAVQASLLRAASPPVPAAPPIPPASPLSPRRPDTEGGRRPAGDCGGQTNAEIATELYISEVTVKSHINHLFAKIGSRSRAEAVRYAYDHGLVAPPS